MRTGRWRLLLLMPAAVAAMTTGPGAMAADPDTLATSSGVSVELGAGQVAVKLATSGKALSARVAGIGGDRKVYLVVRGLGTDAPPETIYQIYLGLPQGVVPSPDGVNYVGALNFFNAPKRGAARSDTRFFSFDVTALLKTLQSRRSLGDDAIVTIVPAGAPRADAKPVIGEIALVEQ